MLQEINTPEEFEKIFLETDKPILLDFYTETCNPCRTLMFVLEKLASEYKDKIEFIKTRADKNDILVEQFRVTSVPTLIFVSKEKQLEKASGVIIEKSLRDKLEQLANE